MVFLEIILGMITLLTGGFMIFDGVHVLINGEYFGPETPGPWRLLFLKIGVDPFKLGPLFIVLGSMWIIAYIILLIQIQYALYIALLVAILTLWYLPVGTLFSLIYIVLIILFQSQL